jgi:tetratricopeptide (TPR) repeat protein
VKFELVIKKFDEALAIDPNQHRALVMKASCLMVNRKYYEAIKIIEYTSDRDDHIVKQIPLPFILGIESSTPYDQLNSILLPQGKYEETLDIYNTFLRDLGLSENLCGSMERFF